MEIFVSFLQPQEDLLCALQGGSAGDLLLHALEQLPEHRLQHALIPAGEMCHSVQRSALGTHGRVATNTHPCARAARSNRGRRAASFPRKPPPASGGGAAVSGFLQEKKKQRGSGFGDPEQAEDGVQCLTLGGTSKAQAAHRPQHQTLQALRGEPDGNAPLRLTSAHRRGAGWGKSRRRPVPLWTSTCGWEGERVASVSQ